MPGGRRRPERKGLGLRLDSRRKRRAGLIHDRKHLPRPLAWSARSCIGPGRPDWISEEPVVRLGQQEKGLRSRTPMILGGGAASNDTGMECRKAEMPQLTASSDTQFCKQCVQKFFAFACASNYCHCAGKAGSYLSLKFAVHSRSARILLTPAVCLYQRPSALTVLTGTFQDKGMSAETVKPKGRWH